MALYYFWVAIVSIILIAVIHYLFFNVPSGKGKVDNIVVSKAALAIAVSVLSKLSKMFVVLKQLLNNFLLLSVRPSSIFHNHHHTG